MSEPVGSEIETFLVVVIPEDQYALRPAGREIPSTRSGRRATREECPAYVSTVWCDMRPRSLRSEPEGT